MLLASETVSAWELLPNEVQEAVLCRGFEGRPPVALWSVSKGLRCSVATTTEYLRTRCNLACDLERDPADRYTGVVADEAALVLCRVIAQLPHLKRVDLRRFPGPRPARCRPLFDVLQNLPASVMEVLLPQTALQSQDDLSKLKGCLRNVTKWVCEAKPFASDQQESDVLLLAGAILLASPSMTGCFELENAVIMLLGSTSSGGWFGVLLNGPVCGTGTDQVRWGGPISSTSKDFWTIYLHSGDAAESNASLVPTSPPRTRVYVGDDWKALRQSVAQASDDMHCFQGYAGWAPGQLEEELRAGDWRLLYCPATLLLANTPPESLYGTLLKSITQLN